jgi:hypothetical protein
MKRLKAQVVVEDPLELQEKLQDSRLKSEEEL